ncbi:AbrB/MazE/SpoVT family DNA-binding domain-containing protein [Candidatus Woesearchaeota archaeon]|nr:AbrB/MazE/SpoVT family DNA-binding domain-containing protein [Candidatus Woesearchaeota archaeon]
MKRKVNKVGNNTLTVSLPSKWAQKHQINAGDELEVIEQRKSLEIQLKTSLKRERKIAHLPIDKPLKHLVNRSLSTLYVLGFEEIEISFKEKKLYDQQEDKYINIDEYLKSVMNKFLGMEVISQSPQKFTLHIFVKDFEEKELSIAQHRIYYLTKEFLETFIAKMKQDFSSFHEQHYFFHDNIAKFNFYFQRILYFSELSEQKKAKMFALYTLIDKIMDTIRHLSNRVNEMKKPSLKVQQVLERIFSWFLAMHATYLENPPDYQVYEPLIKERYTILKYVNKTSFTVSEQKAVSEAIWILDIINEFVETTLFLQEEKFY